jgi:hypothetical protein
MSSTLHPPYLALDVAFTHTPQITFALQDTHSSDRPVSHKPTHNVHDDSAKQMFNVPHAYALVTHNIILLPITIDHHGGLGPFATSFFFGQNNPTITVAAPPPSWSSQTFTHNPMH